MEPLLESKNEAQLRKYADLMRIPLTKDMTRKEIISAIKARQKDKQTIEIAETGTRPKPGWARIEILKDSSPGATNRPVYVQVNGYRCTVPRGVEVDVPIKVVNVLNDSRSVKVAEDKNRAFNDPRYFSKEMLPSYPFQVRDINPGPDPNPSAGQRSRIARAGPREEFREQFGRYPRRDELLQAQKEGFVKMRGDILPPPIKEEASMISGDEAPAE